MLSKESITAFIPTVNPALAKKFYGKTLGLKLLSEDDFAVEFDAHGTRLRVTTVPALIPHPFTVLGWNIEGIVKMVQALTKEGIVFERYDFMEQDKLGIWTAPGGTKVAWFKDPDGNLLSLAESA